MANMEKRHSEALVAKEEEMSARIDKAVVCTPGYFNSGIQHMSLKTVFKHLEYILMKYWM